MNFRHLEFEANNINNWYKFEVGLSLAPQKLVMCIFNRFLAVRKRSWSITMMVQRLTLRNRQDFWELSFKIILNEINMLKFLLIHIVRHWE